MNVPFFIARKYFFSQKKRSFINFISLISMVGICLGTLALVVVLSVFNGLEDLNRQIFKAIDPDLKISSQKAKSFIVDSLMLKKIKQLPDVDVLTQVYQDKALARSKTAQMIVLVKGVDENFEKKSNLVFSVVDGKMKLHEDGRSMAFVGNGVSEILNLTANEILNPLVLIYPKSKQFDVLDSEGNLNRVEIDVSGTFVLEQQYDNYVYIPIEIMEKLTEKVGKRTALEITLKKNADIDKAQNSIQEIVKPSHLVVKNRDEQNAALLKAIKIEKFFIFIALIFIIGIASFNIFYALSMLVIDKSDDIKTMASMGADKGMIKKIFLIEGFIIASIGSSFGLVLGTVLCVLQIKFGWIKLGIKNAVVDAYPIKIVYTDLIYAIVGIIVITFIASIVPAQKASKLMLSKI